MNKTITDVPGVEVGQVQNDQALTGCTVILCRAGAIAGVDVRGGAPGTRETDLLNPINLVQKVHAIVLAGGSAYGLDAAGGVMKYLEENQIGFKTGPAKVPIVPAAILYDLGVGRADIRPDAEMGYRACLVASRKKVKEGNVGAGSGASVGKLFGKGFAMKSGVGSASLKLKNGLIIGALAAVNAFGDVIDPKNGKIIAGLRSSSGYKFADTFEVMKKQISDLPQRQSSQNNTTLGVVAVNADFTKTEMTKIAQMAQDGIGRATRPAHTMFDGDTVFALATGGINADVSIVGALAAEVLAEAIVRAAKAAQSVDGLPGLAN